MFIEKMSSLVEGRVYDLIE